MKEIKELCVFDLDETIIRAPGYTDKKAVESFANIKFNHPYEYYDHPLSLSEDLHNIQLISPVYDAWKKSEDDPESEPVLITHRVKKLEQVVIELLKRRGIDVKTSSFLGRASEKSETLFALLLLYYSNVEKIKIYEDSIDQIFKYQKFFNSKKHNFSIEYWIVDKARMFRIYDVQLTDKTRIELI